MRKGESALDFAELGLDMQGSGRVKKIDGKRQVKTPKPRRGKDESGDNATDFELSTKGLESERELKKIKKNKRKLEERKAKGYNGGKNLQDQSVEKISDGKTGQDTGEKTAFVSKESTNLDAGDINELPKKKKLVIARGRDTILAADEKDVITDEDLEELDKESKRIQSEAVQDSEKKDESERQKKRSGKISIGKVSLARDREENLKSDLWLLKYQQVGLKEDEAKFSTGKFSADEQSIILEKINKNQEKISKIERTLGLNSELIEAEGTQEQNEDKSESPEDFTEGRPAEAERKEDNELVKEQEGGFSKEKMQEARTENEKTAAENDEKEKELIKKIISYQEDEMKNLGEKNELLQGENIENESKILELQNNLAQANERLEIEIEKNASLLEKKGIKAFLKNNKKKILIVSGLIGLSAATGGLAGAGYALGSAGVGELVRRKVARDEEKYVISNEEEKIIIKESKNRIKEPEKKEFAPNFLKKLTSKLARFFGDKENEKKPEVAVEQNQENKIDNLEAEKIQKNLEQIDAFASKCEKGEVSGEDIYTTVNDLTGWMKSENVSKDAKKAVKEKLFNIDPNIQAGMVSLMLEYAMTSDKDKAETFESLKFLTIRDNLEDIPGVSEEAKKWLRDEKKEEIVGLETSATILEMQKGKKEYAKNLVAVFDKRIKNNINEFKSGKISGKEIYEFAEEVYGILNSRAATDVPGVRDGYIEIIRNISPEDQAKIIKSMADYARSQKTDNEDVLNLSKLLTWKTEDELKNLDGIDKETIDWLIEGEKEKEKKVDEIKVINVIMPKIESKPPPHLRKEQEEALSENGEKREEKNSSTEKEPIKSADLPLQEKIKKFEGTKEGRVLDVISRLNENQLKQLKDIINPKPGTLAYGLVKDRSSLLRTNSVFVHGFRREKNITQRDIDITLSDATHEDLDKAIKLYESLRDKDDGIKTIEVIERKIESKPPPPYRIETETKETSEATKKEFSNIYELGNSSEDFENIKLLLEEGGSGKWARAVDTLIKILKSDYNLVTDGIHGSFNIEKIDLEKKYVKLSLIDGNNTKKNIVELSIFEREKLVNVNVREEEIKKLDDEPPNPPDSPEGLTIGAVAAPEKEKLFDTEFPKIEKFVNDFYVKGTSGKEDYDFIMDLALLKIRYKNEKEYNNEVGKYIIANLSVKNRVNLLNSAAKYLRENNLKTEVQRLAEHLDAFMIDDEYKEHLANNMDKENIEWLIGIENKMNDAKQRKKEKRVKPNEDQGQARQEAKL